MLFIFDMDGTLRRGTLPVPSPLRERDQRILPGQAERLRDLDAAGHYLGAAGEPRIEVGCCGLPAVIASSRHAGVFTGIPNQGFRVLAARCGQGWLMVGRAGGCFAA